MTSHKRTYIEPKDIKAMRVDCNDCGASLTLPLGMNMNFASVSRCPNCSRSWATTMQTSIQPVLQQCADAIWNTQAMLTHHQKLLGETGSKGFKVSLELSEPSDLAGDARD